MPTAIIQLPRSNAASTFPRLGSKAPASTVRAHLPRPFPRKVNTHRDLALCHSRHAPMQQEIAGPRGPLALSTLPSAPSRLQIRSQTSNLQSRSPHSHFDFELFTSENRARRTCQVSTFSPPSSKAPASTAHVGDTGSSRALLSSNLPIVVRYADCVMRTSTS